MQRTLAQVIDFNFAHSELANSDRGGRVNSPALKPCHDLVLLNPHAALAEPVSQNRRLKSVLILCAILLVHVAAIYFLIHNNDITPPKIEPTKPMLVSLIAPPKPEPELVPIIQPPKPIIKPEPIIKKVIKEIRPLDRPVENPVEATVEPVPEPVEEVPPQLPAQPQVAEPKAPPQSVIEEKIEPPKFGVAYLNNPEPSYPKMSKRAGEEGRVLLRVLVSQAGAAEEVALEKSSGYERLDEAALEAVKKWRFIPARKNNQSISAQVLVPIKFSLSN